MRNLVDPTLLPKIREYGHFDTNACLNCGGCTIICPLTSNLSFSPRRSIYCGLIGLKEQLRSRLDPWLCYYCGDCSTSCPRQTEPGEAMMTLRRYLIGQYDWTGIASKLYKSKVLCIGALFIAAVFMAILIFLFHDYGLIKLGEVFSWSAIAAVGLFIFVPNMLRMWSFTMRGNKIPITLYLTELKTLILHAVTQIQIRRCQEERRWLSRWLKHWLVAAGWALTLILVNFFGWFETVTYPLYHPFRLFGYLTSLVLAIFAAEIVIGRISKKQQLHKFSDLKDWLFPISLSLIGLTAFLTHAFLSLGLEGVGYGFYIAFLLILAPWALVIVPFGKTTHILYRSLAIYFQTIKERAEQKVREHE